MNYKVIIYDYDGVICDSLDVKTKAFKELYSQYGPKIQKLVEKYHLENGGVSRFEKFKYYETTLLKKKNIDLNTINDLCDKFSFLVKKKVINSKFIPGVKTFIKNNSKEYIQYICTGTPENEINLIINEQRINKYFEKALGSPKNKDEIIKIILEKSNVTNQECIYFGDALTDYIAAKENNIPFIGVKSDNISFPEDVKLIENFLNFSL